LYRVFKNYAYFKDLTVISKETKIALRQRAERYQKRKLKEQFNFLPETGCARCGRFSLEEMKDDLQAMIDKLWGAPGGFYCFECCKEVLEEVKKIINHSK
jgi:hypothetical protein